MGCRRGLLEHKRCPQAKLSHKKRWFLPGFIAGGLLSLLWVVLRVLPKPSRAGYPCQRVAMPAAAGFLAYIGTLLGSVLAIRRARHLYRRSRFIAAGAFVIVACVGIGIHILSRPVSVNAATADLPPFTPTDAPLSPVGQAQGINPGRVVLVHDTAATSWDGVTGKWFDPVNTDTSVVKWMLSDMIQWLSGRNDDVQAWDALFRHLNAKLGRGDHGYRDGEKIGIKINLNQSMRGDRQWQDNAPNPSPAVVFALLWQLVHKAGVPQSAISIGDPSRFLGDPVYEYCHPAFPDVRYIDKRGGEGRHQAVADSSSVIYFADDKMTQSGSTYVATFLSQADYVINMGSLRSHTLAGITSCAKNHFGSIQRATNGKRYFTPMGDDDMLGFHGFIAPRDIDKRQSWGSGWYFKGRPMGSYNPMVELMGHKDLGGKTLFLMIDGLYAALHQSATDVLRFRRPPFGSEVNPDWSSCLIASQDGVAIESVVLDILRTEPAYAEKNMLSGAVDNYLHEAAQAQNPPSGATYDPENDGIPLASLGVHEHWNNAYDKSYSRNLRTGNGIELIMEPPNGNVAVHEMPAYTMDGDLRLIWKKANGKVRFLVTGLNPGTFSVAIYNALGECVWESDGIRGTGRETEFPVSLHSLPSGFLNATVTQGERRVIRQFRSAE